MQVKEGSSFGEMGDLDAENSDLSGLRIDRERRQGPPGRWKRWLHLLWILLPVVAYAGYQIVVARITPSLKVNVDVARYLTGTDAAVELVATGYVVAQVKADVSAKATGLLKMINVEEGDTVVKGDVIAELENNDIMAELEVTRASLKQALADSLAAELNYNRQRELKSRGFTADEFLDNATAAYHKALAGVEAMRASMKVAEVAYENSIIRAPFSGTILIKHADLGEMVAPLAAATSSKAAVVTMADMTSLEVEADVSESNIQKVTVGQPCEIVLDAYPQRKFSGRVKKIVPTADRTRATVLTKIVFNEIDRSVLPEMSARVNFMPTEDKHQVEPATQTLVIKADALTTRDGKQVVFKSDKGYARLTIVIAGRRLGNLVEITSGLSSGDRVILSPAGGLKDGDRVEEVQSQAG
jgi:RND family efflux transporter MFP subunit